MIHGAAVNIRAVTKGRERGGPCIRCDAGITNWDSAAYLDSSLQEDSVEFEIWRWDKGWWNQQRYLRKGKRRLSYSEIFTGWCIGQSHVCMYWDITLSGKDLAILPLQPVLSPVLMKPSGDKKKKKSHVKSDFHLQKEKWKNMGITRSLIIY